MPSSSFGNVVWPLCLPRGDPGSCSMGAKLGTARRRLASATLHALFISVVTSYP